MKEIEVLHVLRNVGAVITDSHIVYTSGRHGTAYINKDAVYSHTAETANLCMEIAKKFFNDKVEVVIAPAVGGVILSQWTAHYLVLLTGNEVLSVYAEKAEKSVFKSDAGIVHNIAIGFQVVGDVMNFNLELGEELVVRDGSFVIKRGYDKLVVGKRVLVVEDVLNTGISVNKTIQAVRNVGGEVIGVGALCNRGGVTAEQLGVSRLVSLVNVKMDAWPEAECPLCAIRVPINTSVGHGAQFLARK